MVNWTSYINAITNSEQRDAHKILEYQVGSECTRRPKGAGLKLTNCEDNFLVDSFVSRQRCTISYYPADEVKGISQCANENQTRKRLDKRDSKAAQKMS